MFNFFEIQFVLIIIIFITGYIIPDMLFILLILFRKLDFTKFNVILFLIIGWILAALLLILQNIITAHSFTILMILYVILEELFKIFSYLIIRRKWPEKSKNLILIVALSFAAAENCLYFFIFYQTGFDFIFVMRIFPTLVHLLLATIFLKFEKFNCKRLIEYCKQVETCQTIISFIESDTSKLTDKEELNLELCKILKTKERKILANFGFDNVFEQSKLKIYKFRLIGLITCILLHLLYNLFITAAIFRFVNYLFI
jgi:hypothetical protein